jgi:aspartyl-tRNA(Asn)/glutamyl-tRNA(Gln) amidotransferase subunit B
MIVDDINLAKYYESITSLLGNDKKKVKLVTNYLLTDYIGLCGLFDIKNAPDPSSFAELINLISNGDLSSRGAKDTLAIIVKESKAGNLKSNVKEIAEKAGLIQKSDASTLGPAIEKVIADNTKAVEEYRGGKVASLQFLIGQVMKISKGSANPGIVKELLEKKLK